MTTYTRETDTLATLCQSQGSAWKAINPEYASRMRLQNRFRTGIEIAQYTADVMREDMAAYDKDTSQYTQSLGCWHGFTAQQMMMAIKRHQKTTKRSYVYLSGWMVAALRSAFGPLPDQSMHEKTSVPALIEEIYTFLKQADARELDHLFNDLDEAKANGGDVQAVLDKIDNFETHVVPIIADIDAGFGNEEATYLLAKKMIEAGACAIQIENQVSDAKQCGHQAGKVTVPHEDFLAKINAVRYAFLELGIDNGIIVARTDSLGASLTQKVPVSQTPGDLASQYNAFLETTPINGVDDLNEGDTAMKINGQLCKPTRLENGLYQFREGTEKDRVYNNSPSFNWTLKFREQVYQEWQEAGRDLSAYPSLGDNKGLMAPEMDDTELAAEADVLVQNFQRDGAREAGIFHHLITLPTYHTAALSTDILSEGYFGDMGMLAYVRDVQRQEIRREQASVKHQDLAGSNIGDTHKEYFSGENALKAGGEDNTMNQF